MQNAVCDLRLSARWFDRSAWGGECPHGQPNRSYSWFVGGRNYQENQNNHAIDTKRSPASTTKPILAMVSLLTRFDGSAVSYQTILPTSQTGIPSCMSIVLVQVWWPWEKPWTIHGTFQPTGLIVRFERGCRCQGLYGKKMGYEIPEYGIESLPMGGGIEVTVAQHTNGYQTLANNGFTIRNIGSRRSSQRMADWYTSTGWACQVYSKRQQPSCKVSFGMSFHLQLLQVSRRTWRLSIHP